MNNNFIIKRLKLNYYKSLNRIDELQKLEE